MDMIEFLWLLALFSFSGIGLILGMMQFAVGEPTGRHSKYAPGAVPVSKIVHARGGESSWIISRPITINVTPAA